MAPVNIGKLTLYSIAELSELLKVTPETLRAYIQQGRIHGAKMGGQWFISETALADFFEPGSRKKLETAVRKRVQELSPPLEKPARKKQAPRKRDRQKQKQYTTTTKTIPDAGTVYLLPDIIKGLHKKYGGYDAVAQEIKKCTGNKYTRRAVAHWTEKTRFPKPAALADICTTFKLNYDELHRNMQEIKLERKREKLLSGQ